VSLSREELLKIASTHGEALKSSPHTQKSEARRFIEALDIKEGKHLVRARLIYACYRRWAYKPIKRASFFAKFALFFEPYFNRKHSRYYLLNYKSVELANTVDNLKIKIRKIL